MTYHLGRGSSQLGEFTEAEVREGLASGKFLASDLAWTSGMADWKPVSEVFPGISAAPVVSAPPPAEEPVSVPFDDPNSAGPAFAPVSASASSQAAAVTPPESASVSTSVIPPVVPAQYIPPPGVPGGNVGVGVMPVPGTAIASLILGLVSLVTCYFGVLFAIPGVICGHMAMSKIKNSGYQYDGKGLAKAGLILNYIWIGVAALILMALIVFGIIGAATGAFDTPSTPAPESAPATGPSSAPSPPSGPTSDV